jgi:hypothetical protein
MAVKTFTSEILTSADTNTYLANSGLVYVTSATATSGSTFSINNCFTSTFTNYKIVANISGSTAALYMRLRAAGTDTTTGYYYNGTFMTYTSAVVGGFAGSNVGFFDTGVVADSVRGGSSIDVFNPQTATATTFNCNGTDPRTGGGGARYASGVQSASTVFDGFTLYNSTFTSITVTVYGYRSA